MNIAAGLDRAAAVHGARIALRFGETHLTYRDLSLRVNALAATLSRRGIGRGDSFAVVSDNNLELLQLYYAAARIGAVFVPVNQSLSAREVAYITRHIEAKFLFHDTAHAEVVKAAMQDPRRCAIDALLHENIADSKLIPAHDRVHDDFLVIYTSGSTGVPKAVVFDQAAEMAGNQSLIEMWGLGPDDVTLVALPLGFLYGLSTAAATGIQAGGEVVVMRRFHPGEVIAALVESRATVFHGVPTMFSMMLDYAEQNRLSVDLSSVRLLISAGAPLSEELRVRFHERFNKPIEDYYALTEVRPIFGKLTNDPRPIPNGSIGCLAPGAAVRVMDTDGKEVPTGEQGELFVRAPATLKRYHKDDALTQAALKDGWFRTGDLGYCDGEGYFYLTGRVKDVIIRGGANVAPAEVEEILNTHPAIQSAAVIGVPDSRFGEVPVAYLVLRGKANVAEETLAAFCSERLAEFKRPAAFVFLPSHPLGPTGKIDKKALKTMWLEGHR
jgi:long-chain acyl-CoA synthetase